MLGTWWGVLLEQLKPDRRRAGSSREDGKFVTQHDDLQLLEVVRPPAQGRDLQHPPKHQIAQREEHNGSGVAR